MRNAADDFAESYAAYCGDRNLLILRFAIYGLLTEIVEGDNIAT